MSIVVRRDSVTLKALNLDRDGYLVTQARAARTGILTYIKDGKPFRELVPKDVLFGEESKSTAIGLPFTNRHPREKSVNADNAADLMRGFTQGPVTEEKGDDGEDYLGLGVKLMDKRTIKQVQDGVVELSFGYEAHLDMTPGTYKGQPYDATQVRRLHNHLALVPKARAGSNSRLRLDADNNLDEEPDMEMVTIKIDGKDVEVPKASAEAIQAGLAKAATSRADAADATALAAEKQRADTAEAELLKFQEEKKKAATAEGKKDEAARIDAMVKERATVLDQAKSLIPKADHAKLDALDNLAVMSLVLTTLDAEEKLDGKSEDFIKGAFAAAVKGAKETKGDAASVKLGGKIVHAGKGTAPAKNQDGATVLNLDQAIAEKKRDLADRWKQPLTVGAAKS